MKKLPESAIMKAKHIIPGVDDPTCGIAIAAKQLIARGVGSDDEVWVHSMWTPLVIKASIKALLSGKKLVRMPHGCTDPEKLRYHWNKKRWVAPIERWLFRKADRIIATCEDEKEWIKAFEPKVKRVEIVLLSAQSVGQPSAHVPLGNLASKMGRRLLYVGRLHPLKGVEFLFEAVPQDCKLVVIGKDEGLGQKLREIATRRELDVEFKGVVSERDKEAAYQWCDVLVLPTLSENFGLVVAEALERGKFVITTDGAPAWADLKPWQGIYIKGFRNGSENERIALLKNAIARGTSAEIGICAGCVGRTAACQASSSDG